MYLYVYSTWLTELLFAACCRCYGRPVSYLCENIVYNCYQCLAIVVYCCMMLVLLADNLHGQSFTAFGTV